MMPRRTHFIGGVVGVLLALSTLGIRPAGAQSSTDVVLTVGRAFGGGNILVAPGQYASFRFQLDPETAGQSRLGQVQFFNRITNERVVSLRITSAFVIPGMVSVEGICTVNGRPSVFQMEAFDGFNLSADNFFICYGDPITGSCVGGYVVAGSVMIDPNHIPFTRR